VHIEDSESVSSNATYIWIRSSKREAADNVFHQALRDSLDLLDVQEKAFIPG